MPESGKPRGYLWAQDELDIFHAHPDFTPRELHELLPHRSISAIAQLRQRGQFKKASPAVKATGEYVETVAGYLVDESACMGIWLRWNGYTSYRELIRDSRGWVTVLCTAK
jgi:hypothetical protein